MSGLLVLGTELFVFRLLQCPNEDQQEVFTAEKLMKSVILDVFKPAEPAMLLNRQAHMCSHTHLAWHTQKLACDNSAESDDNDDDDDDGGGGSSKLSSISMKIY